MQRLEWPARMPDEWRRLMSTEPHVGGRVSCMVSWEMATKVERRGEEREPAAIAKIVTQERLRLRAHLGARW